MFFDTRGRVVNICFITTEVAPFIKVGGLADVSGGLAKALHKAGLRVGIIVPFHRRLMRQDRWRRRRSGDVYETEHEGVPLWALRHDAYFDREHVYGGPDGDYPDNLKRFVWFCRRALDVLDEIAGGVDVLHVHDWPTSLVPVYTKNHPRHQARWGGTPVVLTIHNLSHQGIFPKEDFGLLDLPDRLWSVQGLEYYDRINLLKGGLMFADHITTVSPTYAREILTPEYGCGLDGVLRQRADHLSGILNGIDDEDFNPRTDRALWRRYSADTLSDREKNKTAMLTRRGWPCGPRSVLGAFIGRLSEQKGLEPLMKALPRMLEDPEVCFIILGQGERRYADALRDLMRRLRNDRFCFADEFNEDLARRLYASCDVFVMPSVFEPCGLGQMIAMRYGALPLVHATGGLVDTVRDVSEGGWGFVFRPLNESRLLETWARAVSLCRDGASKADVQRRAMQQDHSWTRRVEEYIALYKRVLRG